MRSSIAKLRVTRKVFQRNVGVVNVSPRYIIKKRHILFGICVLLASWFSYEEYKFLTKRKEEELFRKRIDLQESLITSTAIPLTTGFKIRAFFRFVYLLFVFWPLIVLLPFTRFNSIAKIWWEMLNCNLRKLGGCWIKLGQWMTTRPDLFSIELTTKISQLVDQCPMHPFEDTVRTVEQALNINDINQQFTSFDMVPIASGAIAQVHSAIYQGEKVAVKVLHPNINDQITLDLYVMNVAKNLLLLIPGSEWLSLNDALFQFSQSMQYQTNLALEGINLQKFSHNFEDFKGVIFPRFIHSSPELLIESFEKGVSLVSYLKVPHNVEEKKKLGKLGLTAFLKMMLKDNFVHADLHSGNMLVRRNTKTNAVELIMLDVGLVTSATPEDWHILKKLLVALSTNDSQMAAGLMIEHAKHKNLPQSEEVNFIREMSATFDEVFRSNMNDIDVGKILNDILSINRRYQVQIAGNFSTLCLGCVVLEGIGKQLDPDVNLLQEAKPFLFEKEKFDFFVKLNLEIDHILGKFYHPRIPLENSK